MNSAILPDLPNEGILKAVYQFNQLRSFSLSKVEIIEWAQSIQRLCPDLDLDKLNFVIDRMKLGEISYDQKEGIQNIFRGLNMVTVENGKFKVLKAIW